MAKKIALRQPLSPEWTAQDRLRIIAALLPGLSEDIYAGRYSAMGRPNVTSLQHITVGSPKELEHARKDCENAVSKFEADMPKDFQWSK